jgi:excisionase family DNA binding protein
MAVDLPNRPWIRVREAAAFLDLSRSSVQRLVNEGMLVAHRPGKRDFRISRESLVAYREKKIDLGPEFEFDDRTGQGRMKRLE